MSKIVLTITLVLSSFGMNALSQQTLNATVEKTDIYDNASLGSAKVNIKGGNTPYYVLWSSGSTQQKVAGLKPGTYVVRISDSKGTTIEKKILIEDRSKTTLSANP